MDLERALSIPSADAVESNFNSYFPRALATGSPTYVNCKPIYYPESKGSRGGEVGPYVHTTSTSSTTSIVIFSVRPKALLFLPQFPHVVNPHIYLILYLPPPSLFLISSFIIIHRFQTTSTFALSPTQLLSLSTSLTIYRTLSNIIILLFNIINNAFIHLLRRSPVGLPRQRCSRQRQYSSCSPPCSPGW